MTMPSKQAPTPRQLPDLTLRLRVRCADDLSFVFFLMAVFYSCVVFPRVPVHLAGGDGGRWDFLRGS